MSLPFHTLLSATQQRDAGIENPAPIAMADRVHHDDCDTLNHVNNTRYFVWFERLRIRFAAEYGIGVLGDPASPRIVIRSGHMHWKEEMLWGEDYVTLVRCTAFRRTSMSLSQAVWAGGRERATFDCVLVLLTQDGSQRFPIPEDIKQRLIADGAVTEPSA